MPRPLSHSTHHLQSGVVTRTERREAPEAFRKRSQVTPKSSSTQLAPDKLVVSHHCSPPALKTPTAASTSGLRNRR